MSSLPRLLVCSFDAIPSATSTSRRLTEYLRGLPTGLAVDVICPKESELPFHGTLGPARIFRVPLGTGSLESRGATFDRAVRRHLESEDYALAHFTHPFGGLALCELKRELGFRLLYDAQTFLSAAGDESPFEPFDRKLLFRQELFCLMQSDAIVTGSSLTQRYIHSLGVPLQNITVLRAPVSVSDYPVITGERVSIPGLRLLFLGNPHSLQGLETLLDALARIPKRQLVELVVCGSFPGALQQKLQTAIAQRRLGFRATLLPDLPHHKLPSLLSQMDVGVFPLTGHERNHVQGGPLSKASEYLAAGCPVLASDLPQTREALPSHSTFFYPPKDSEKLAALISHLLTHPDARLEASQRAQDWAFKNIDSSLICRALLDVYRSMCGAEFADETIPARPPPQERRETLHTQLSGVIGPIEPECVQTDTPFFDAESWHGQLVWGYCPPAPFEPPRRTLPDTD